LRLFYGIDFDLISLNKIFLMKIITNIILFSIVLTGFTNCSSAQKLEKRTSFNIGEVYFQSWVAGIKGGGSGTNIFIPIEDNLTKTVQLDSVYFRGKASKLEFKPTNPSLFIGRFLSSSNLNKELIMSDEPNAEYGNKLPDPKISIPFELKPNECVISYIKEGKTLFYKIENIIERKSIPYPSAPLQKQ
jgi:hypothetical protein